MSTIWVIGLTYNFAPFSKSGPISLFSLSLLIPNVGLLLATAWTHAINRAGCSYLWIMLRRTDPFSPLRWLKGSESLRTRLEWIRTSSSAEAPRCSDRPHLNCTHRNTQPPLLFNGVFNGDNPHCTSSKISSKDTRGISRQGPRVAPANITSILGSLHQIH